MAGMLFDILKVVHSALGFNFTLISPVPSDENPWTDLIGMVARFEVDFSMMDTILSIARLKVIIPKAFSLVIIVILTNSLHIVNQVKKLVFLCSHLCYCLHLYHTGFDG